jgi:hypothetical protein
MAESDDAPKKKLPPSEQTWIRNFIEFYGTDNVTRVFRENLGGVTLIEVVEALATGNLVSAEKLDDAGTTCTLRHASVDAIIEVDVWFVASEIVLEIRAARRVKEMKGETDDAA